MENDNDDSIVPAPNDFLISTYFDNFSLEIRPKKMYDDKAKVPAIYRCLCCKKTHENPTLTCAQDVNEGRFGSSNHRLCWTKRREELLSFLSKDAYKEFQEYIKENNLKSDQIQYSDGKFLLKKYQTEKELLQTEYEEFLLKTCILKSNIDRFQFRSKRLVEICQLTEEIGMRRKRVTQMKQLIGKLREHINQKKAMNKNTGSRLVQIRLRIQHIEEGFKEIKVAQNKCNETLITKIKHLKQGEKVIRTFRRKYLQDLYAYIFPIELISSLEGANASIIRALREIWDDDDDNNNSQSNNNTQSVELIDPKYRIVNSFLSEEDQEHVENIVTLYNASVPEEAPEELPTDSIVFVNDLASPSLSPSIDSLETLSALSHACQLINAISWILGIRLPFHMQHIEFFKNRLSVEGLRANILKLNANIVSTCLAQGIAVEKKEHCTLENLYKLLKLKSHPIRPYEYSFSPEFLSLLETEIKDVDGALNNQYWFDYYKDDNQNSEETHSLENNTQSDAHNDESVDSSTLSEINDSSMTDSSLQQSAVMTNSTSFMKKSSDFVFSLFGNRQS